MYQRIIPIALSMAIYSSSFASIVAVIDSGVDVDHEDLKNQILVNDEVEDENDQYQNDIYGWNFIANNNAVYDSDFKKNYSTDIEKYYYMQYANFLKTKQINVYDDDLTRFVYSKLFNVLTGRQNTALIDLANAYGGYSHGTHVAGIVARHEGNKILSVKMIPSTETYEGTAADVRETELRAKMSLANLRDGTSFQLSNKELAEAKKDLTEMAIKKANEDSKIFSYVSNRGARVANGSYGTGYPLALNMIKASFLGLDSAQTIELATFLIDEYNYYASQVFEMNQNLLFVAASGNDGLNNDVYPDFPSCSNASNVLSVGATWQDNERAYFSNYGASTVDVFAPGVGIKSTVPGGHLYMSGTSQAAPQVARIAGRLFDVNDQLSVSDVKTIIMDTVDKKEFLKGKCISEGIVNEERAVYVAKLMKDHNLSIDDAILVSREEINDVVYEQYLKSNVVDVDDNAPFEMVISKRINTITVNFKR